MAASIALHAVVFPSMTALEGQDASFAAALQSIKTALERAEEGNPGLTHELVDAIIENEQAKGGFDSTEKFLRAAVQELDDYKFALKTDELKDLDAKSKALKKLLSTIPDVIKDRTKFLELIREIATGMRDMLAAVNAVAKHNEELLGSHKQTLDQHKKVFVRGCKSFSDTMKDYFKNGKAQNVYRVGHRLINQTNTLLRTLRIATVES